MSYVNKVQHYKFGDVWYRMELRNWCVLGATEEENRARGPVCELVCVDYMLSACGRTPLAAEICISNTLDYYAESGDPLPLHSEQKESLWRRLRWIWRTRNWKRDGVVAPVRIPEPSRPPR